MQHWTIKPVFNVIQMHICISTGKTGLNRLIYISGLSLNSLGFWDNGWSNNYHYSNRTHLGIIPITKSSSLFFYRHQKFISYIIYVALFHIQTTKFPIVGEMPPQELTPATTTAQVSSSISAVYRLTWGFFFFFISLTWFEFKCFVSYSCIIPKSLEYQLNHITKTTGTFQIWSKLKPDTTNDIYVDSWPIHVS